MRAAPLKTSSAAGLSTMACGYNYFVTTGRHWPYWLIGLFTLGSVAVYLLKPGSELALDVLTNFISVGSAAIAFVAAARVSRRGDSIRAPAGWLWLTIGLGFFMLGEVSWAVQEAVLRIKNPFPSIADIFWLLGYPFLLLGLVMAWDCRTPCGRAQ